MKQDSNKITIFTGLPRQSWTWLAIIIVFSALVHLISIVNLDRPASQSSLPYPHHLSEPSKVTVRIREKPKVKPKKQEEAKDEEMQRIVETPMSPTDAPEKSTRLGAQDHRSEKETKISQLLPHPKAADPGQAGRETKVQNAARAQPFPQTTQRDKPRPEEQSPPSKAQAETKTMLLSPSGKVAAPRAQEHRPRNVYESLMPRSDEMAEQVQAGYQDYVDDEVDVGDRVDLNTTNFRYLGYFTSLRKAFEMVWSYPSEAVQRGLQGEVKVEFTIQKDGKLTRAKVLSSSGHRILDQAVLDALRLASPFSPLPEGMKKDKLTVVGSFRYVLTNYAGAM